MSATEIGVDLSRYKLGWSDEEDYAYKPQKGLDDDMIRSMSSIKDEPERMLDFPPDNILLGDFVSLHADLADNRC